MILTLFEISAAILEKGLLSAEGIYFLEIFFAKHAVLKILEYHGRFVYSKQETAQEIFFTVINIVCVDYKFWTGGWPKFLQMFF